MRAELHLRWKGEAFHEAVCGKSRAEETWKRRKKSVRILLGGLLLIVLAILIVITRVVNRAYGRELGT